MILLLALLATANAMEVADTPAEPECDNTDNIWNECYADMAVCVETVGMDMMLKAKARVKARNCIKERVANKEATECCAAYMENKETPELARMEPFRETANGLNTWIADTAYLNRDPCARKIIAKSRSKWSHGNKAKMLEIYEDSAKIKRECTYKKKKDRDGQACIWDVHNKLWDTGYGVMHPGSCTSQAAYANPVLLTSKKQFNKEICKQMFHYVEYFDKSATFATICKAHGCVATKKFCLAGKKQVKCRRIKNLMTCVRFKGCKIVKNKCKGTFEGW